MIFVENLAVQFNGEYLFHSVSFKINSGDKIGVVGPNGCGKTTLLKILANEIEPQEGTVNIQKGIKIGYLQQDYISIAGDKTLFEEVYSSHSEILELEFLESKLLKDLATTHDEKVLKQLWEVQTRLQHLNPLQYRAEVYRILTGLGFEEKDFDKRISNFSGGWKVRVALAKILVADTDILLLDEPTNHLDFDSLEFLIEFLKSYRGALVIISHDTHFLTSVTNKTLGFSFGKVNLFNGNVNEFYKSQEEKRQQLLMEYRNQQRKVKQIERFIQRFRYKATKARQVQNRIKMLNKIESIEIPKDEEVISFNFDSIPRSGEVVVSLKNITKAYYNKLVLNNLTFQIERNDKIAVIGVNGSGKSTLAKILAGKEPLTSGEIKYGYNVSIGYYSQNLIEELNPENTVLSEIEFVDASKTQAQLRTLLGCFLFHGDDVFKKVDVLSGGEKSRLLLLKILLQKNNFLILDEPTNHLDFTSKRILQEALVDYEGTLLIISHDVDFLDPIVNKVIELKNNQMKLYLGNISEFILKKKTDELEKVNFEKENIRRINQRKLKKKIEAEKRQKFYSLTKGLKEKIIFLENEITRLETRKREIEQVLAGENLSKNDFDIFSEYQKVLEKVNEYLKEWEELLLQYEKIEKEFFSEGSSN